MSILKVKKIVVTFTFSLYILQPSTQAMLQSTFLKMDLLPVAVATHNTLTLLKHEISQKAVHFFSAALEYFFAPSFSVSYSSKHTGIQNQTCKLSLYIQTHSPQKPMQNLFVAQRTRHSETPSTVLFVLHQITPSNFPPSRCPGPAHLFSEAGCLFYALTHPKPPLQCLPTFTLLLSIYCAPKLLVSPSSPTPTVPHQSSAVCFMTFSSARCQRPGF